MDMYIYVKIILMIVINIVRYNFIYIYIMTNIYYTIVGKTDGFGAQYQAILSGIAYCKFKNYIYIHTPF